MANWFHHKDEGFAAAFDSFLQKRGADINVREKVAKIIADTRKRGDKALIEQAKKFDNTSLEQLKLPQEHINEVASQCSPQVLEALNHAAKRIEAWHQKQLPQTIHSQDEQGVKIEQRWRPIEAVGIYVPGGSALYPSSVLMNGLPAKIAGCARIAAAAPANSTHDPLLMAAFKQVGISEVWQMGGAGAIAAFAFGTQTIAKVDKITGPGNAYVAEAKRQVFGVVGIDMIAGPSEILVIADKNNQPDWIAADLLSQAEHDELAQSILICDDKHFAEKIAQHIKLQLDSLPRKKIARASWEQYGAIIIVDSLEDSIPLANQIAAEHLQILTAQAERLTDKINNAGTIFIGTHTPEVLGDYVIGTNHILPTSQAARFSSGLSVYDFMKRTSITFCPPESFDALAQSAETLAKAEGLEAHARAVAIRRQSNKPALAFHSPDKIRERSEEPPLEKKAHPAAGAVGAHIKDIQFGAGLEKPRREELEFERKAALYDLLEKNLFHYKENPPEGHKLTLSCEEGRLVFVNQAGLRFSLALSSLLRLVRDYFLLCESYYDSIKHNVHKVEELDKERRALHNEGAEMLGALLQTRGSITTDDNTARRLFTLICVMYMR